MGMGPGFQRAAIHTLPILTPPWPFLTLTFCAATRSFLYGTWLDCHFLQETLCHRSCSRMGRHNPWEFYLVVFHGLP
ncbi:hypothetical protein NC651_039322 [Populus alba x Populus x berolinensis]|nr:hypothetical protein NC651_039322 [Populus alba x Populus x berolinensis]